MSRRALRRTLAEGSVSAPCEGAWGLRGRRRRQDVRRIIAEADAESAAEGPGQKPVASRVQGSFLGSGRVSIGGA